MTANNRSIDLVVVTLANLMNTVMVVVFVLRSLAVGRLQAVGFVWAVMILVLACVVTLNVRAKR